MITSGIFFKNFKGSKQNSKIKKNLKKLIKENNQILQSFSKNYKDQFKIKNLGIFKRFEDIRIIGIGGSSLGTKTIYSFLKDKIKKNVLFYDNLSTLNKKSGNKKHLNLMIVYSLIIYLICFFGRPIMNNSTIFARACNCIKTRIQKVLI